MTAPKAAARIAENLPFLDAAGAVRHGPIPRSRSLPLISEGGTQQAEGSRRREAEEFVPIRAISARKAGRNMGCAGWAKGLKALCGGGRVRAVTWSTAGLDYTYAIIR